MEKVECITWKVFHINILKTYAYPQFQILPQIFRVSACAQPCTSISKPGSQHLRGAAQSKTIWKRFKCQLITDVLVSGTLDAVSDHGHEQRKELLKRHWGLGNKPKLIGLTTKPLTPAGLAARFQAQLAAPGGSTAGTKYHSWTALLMSSAGTLSSRQRCVTSSPWACGTVGLFSLLPGTSPSQVLILIYHLAPCFSASASRECNLKSSLPFLFIPFTIWSNHDWPYILNHSFQHPHILFSRA